MLVLSHLLGTCLPSLCSPPFPLHAPALIPLSHQDAALSNVTIWCSGQTALFLFFLSQATLAYLPTALSVALRPLFPFHQAQYVQVFRLKPAPFFKLFAGLGSTYKSATSILLSPSYLLRFSCHLNLSGRSGRNCLLFPPVLSDYNGSPDTRFSRGTKRLMSWLDWERYSCPLQSLVVSVLSHELFSSLGL